MSGATQSLTVAFSFGILLQAAIGASFIFIRSNEGSLLADGRRLVLIFFFIFASLWTVTEFLNLIITSTSSSLCQVSLVVSTIADQVARVSVEQFLLWSVGHGTKVSIERMILQGVLLLRMVAGGVLGGFSRPEFIPVCSGRPSLMPVAFGVLGLDALIIGVLLMRAVTLGVFRDMRQEKSEARRSQSKGLIMTIAGLIGWTVSSIPLILGMPSIFLLRTALPAGGLFILIVLLVLFSENLILPTGLEDVTTPEARSPFIPTTSTREIMRAEIGNGAPMPNPPFTRNENLLGANLSLASRDVPKSLQIGQTGADRDNFTLGSNQLQVRAGQGGRPILGKAPPRPAPPSSQALAHLPLPTSAAPLEADSENLAPDFNQLQSVGEQEVLPFPGKAPPRPAPSTSRALAPAPPPIAIVPLGTKIENPKEDISVFSPTEPKPKERGPRFARGKSSKRQANVQGLVITHPHMSTSAALVGLPTPKMHTIDLATAAVNERERREGANARARLVTNKLPPPRPVAPSQLPTARKSVAVEKDASKSDEGLLPIPPSSSAFGLSVEKVNGNTTSASISPRRDELRRRSPRNFPTVDDDTTPAPGTSTKASVGLPSNPRSRGNVIAIAAITQEQKLELQNSIISNRSGVVKTIIKQAPQPRTAGQTEEKAASSPASYTTAPRRLGSVVLQSDAAKKDLERSESLSPVEKSTDRDHIKSHLSAKSAKSMFNIALGSPTALPPLPPPPAATTGRAGRKLPNDTKSMTFKEKVELLSRDGTDHRRSSVPLLPVQSSVHDSASPTRQNLDEGGRDSSQRASTWFFGDMDKTVLPVENEPTVRRNEQRPSYWFNNNAHEGAVELDGDTNAPTLPFKGADTSRKPKDKSLPASPSAPTVRKSPSIMAKSQHSGDDAISFWGSVHSHAPVVDISKAKLTARETIIRRKSLTPIETDKSDLPIQEKADYGFVNVALDEAESRSDLESRDPKKNFSFDEESPSSQDSAQSTISWHRRIGDELPSFSERQTKPTARKMPPPAPLLLGRPGRQATVVRNPEPSPLESPDHAIQDLREQLERLDEPDRGSVGSLLRRMPDAEIDPRGNPGGTALLENLEREMGLQESAWQQMQTSLDRDSMSFTMSPARHDPEPTISREHSQRSQQKPSTIVARRARIRSSMTVRSKGDESGSTPSTESSVNTRASAWQQRLAEAQVEYMDNAPTLLENRNLNSNFKLKSKITPPNSEGDVDSATDIESESDSESESAETERMHTFKSKKQALMWQPIVHAFEPVTRALWILSSPIIRQSTCEPAAKDLRPAPRFSMEMLSISSNLLWTQPRGVPKKRAGSLWTSQKTIPKSILVRPITQRPQRKSKRQTFLPDIVESPKPVPNKRETLGIFQFPWGELSDQPIYQPAFDLSMLAATGVNAKLDARSRQLEPEVNEYESSFFDDYDEDQSDEDAGNASDDDFDETTLWEIASLLKTDDIPRKMSLNRNKDAIDDYDERERLEFNNRELSETMKVAPLSSAPQKTLPLWTKGTSLSNVTPSLGLAQPDHHVWSSLVISATPEVSQKQRSIVDLPRLATYELWTAPQPKAFAKLTSNMWSAKLTSQSMWTPAPKARDMVMTGLFGECSQRTDYRTTTSLPAALTMVRKPRTIESPMAKLTSDELWSGSADIFEDHDWISESSVRPASPSVGSASSSGRSTPESDASSAVSMNTKASSVWTATAEPKIALRKLGTHLISVQESRELSLTQQWDSSVSTLDAMPLQRFGDVGRHRLAFSYPSSWEAALAEAMAASTPQKKLIRLIASPADWDAALATAVSLSNAVSLWRPRLQRPAYSQKLWADALNEALSSSESTTIAVPDATIPHSVTVTKSFIRSPHLLRRARPTQTKGSSISLWTRPTQAPKNIERSALWSVKTDKQELFSNTHTEPWKQSKRPDRKLKQLETWNLWRPSMEVPQSPKNWLKKKEVRGVVFRY